MKNRPFNFKALMGVILFLEVCWCPLRANASTGCTVLLYYVTAACDASAIAPGTGVIPVTEVIPILQAAGANVTTIGVCSATYNPSGDNWSNYSQVWDMRFIYADSTSCVGGIPSPVYEDFFNSNWQTTATTYLENNGSLFLVGEDDGYFSRNTGNIQFFDAIGATSATFNGCSYGTATTNGYSNLGPGTNATNGLEPSTWAAEGNPTFFGDQVGGIPLALLNGSNIVEDPTAGDWFDSNVRSIVSSWSGSAQMTALTGGSVGKMMTAWDQSGWIPNGTDFTTSYGAPPSNHVAILTTFYQDIYQWLGGTSCVPTNTPTTTPTNTPVNTPTNTPTNTATNTATNTPTPASNVTISKTCDVSTASPGTFLNYTITVNVTGTTINGVSVNDLTPLGETFNGSGGNIGFRYIAGVAGPGGVELTWAATTGSLSPGTYQINYQEFVNSGFCGNLPNTASLTYLGLASPITASANVNVPCPTSTFTPTPTATPNLYVWPNPFNPSTAVNGVLQAGYLPATASMSIYTITGELVTSYGGQNSSSPKTSIFYDSATGSIDWYGRNSLNYLVSTGVYFYVIQNAGQTLLTGKLLVITGK